MKKLIAASLLVSLLVPHVALAQDALSVPDPLSARAIAAIQREDVKPTPLTNAAKTAGCEGAGARAKEDAQHVGGMGAGVVWGLCLGLIGMALAAVTVGTPEPPASALQGQDKEYVACYTDRYRPEAKSKKTSNRLVGALIGSAAFIAIILVASSNGE